MGAKETEGRGAVYQVRDGEVGSEGSCGAVETARMGKGPF